MRITTIEATNGSPYISRANISQQMSMCLSSVDNRIREIKKEIQSGRYPESSVIKDGGFVLVNYLVFIDYMNNRQKLLESNLRKYVGPFRPAQVAREIGWYN